MASSGRIFPAEEAAILARTRSYNKALIITRPANVTAYTANDVVGATAAALTFPTMGSSGGRVQLVWAQLEIDVAAVPAGMTNFLLHFYSVTPPSALADNAPFDIPAGDRASYLGAIDLGTPVDRGSTLTIEGAQSKYLKLASGSLFAYLVTVGGFTPAGNSEVYVVTLHTKEA